MDETIAQEVVKNSSAVVEALKLLASGGVGAAAIGLLGKLWVDRKLERERASYGKELENLKAKLAQKHTIHKLQFEKEFEIYVELWEALCGLKEACAALVPGGQFTNKSPEDLREEQADKFAAAYTEFVKLVEHQRPFYASDVYKGATLLLSDAWRQMVQHAFDKETPLTKRYEQMRSRVAEMSGIIDNIESSIRKRIGFISSAELVE